MNDLKRLEFQVRKQIQNDPAHDFEHIIRVCKNVKKIAKHENVNPNLVLAAALLHDVVSFPKSDKRSKTSSLKSAQKAKEILKRYSYTQNEIKIIVDAITDHSFSRNMTPKTIEGMILQDADRLDALGAIGIARTFSVGGAENRPIYSTTDPFCRNRAPNDQNWTVDHFYRKLLLLEKKMNTKFAKKEAKRRTKILKEFLVELGQEI
ncbi:HD domain-containing protein [Candidatus Nitrosotenuis sp. DW1]|uniref:HD domain-containing protein n=1 Tax=Candidatus Nitrosotenuis sp. DW1 TaxID=2259672 RepID=UPI0015C7B696|nr:HD domain-containing protein [Candidatus Nitrosotenuis sp. DW1]QLH08508.1 phosphohydrolase [Candidatus Nitrosotenuis sp. DW1]